MATFKFEGLKEYEKMLNRLGAKSQAVAKKSVYAAANIVAEEIRKGLDGLTTTSNTAAILAWKQDAPSRITEEQKRGLQEGFGVAPFRNEFGYIQTKLGFDGYNSVATRRWPLGQPNAMVARSCENGSSAMIRQRFIAPAVSRAKKRAEKEMAQVFDAETEKIMK